MSKIMYFEHKEVLQSAIPAHAINEISRHSIDSSSQVTGSDCYSVIPCPLLIENVDIDQAMSKIMYF